MSGYRDPAAQRHGPRGARAAARRQRRLRGGGDVRCTWRIVDIVFQQHRVDYKVIIEAGGWEVIKRYVARGLGVSIVSSICMTEEDRLASIPLDTHFPSRTYGVVLRRGKFLSPAARRFLEMIEPDRSADGSAGMVAGTRVI